MKYLIWAAVLYFAWRWYLTAKEKSARTDAQPDKGSGDGANRRNDSAAAAGASASSASAATAAVEGTSEKMVGCAHCGVHLPLSEALTEVLTDAHPCAHPDAQPGAQSRAEPRHYCCEEHRALHARA